MARESTVTQERVSAAAESIKANGGRPSSRGVREVLGSGSMGTILKLLQVWQSGQESRSIAIDDSVDAAISKAINNRVALAILEATAAANAALADLQAEAATVIAENERQAGDLEAMAAERAALTEKLAIITGRATQIEAEATRLAADLTQERNAAEQARIQLAKSELRLEASQEKNKGLESQLAVTKSELSIAVVNANNLAVEAAELRGHLAAVTGKVDVM